MENYILFHSSSTPAEENMSKCLFEFAKRRRWRRETFKVMRYVHRNRVLHKTRKTEISNIIMNSISLVRQIRMMMYVYAKQTRLLATSCCVAPWVHSEDDATQHHFPVSRNAMHICAHIRAESS
jgi:hypothetical protein